MLASPRNYFRYFALSPDVETWGIGLAASGWTRVPVGNSYPPGRHPEDHHFNWERGRVLDSMQIVLITRGSGIFESKATGIRKISAGTVFVVLPGVWHRYRPDLDTGWVESWIEVSGPVIGRLQATNAITPANSVRRVDETVALEAVFDRLHEKARRAPASFDPELSAAALAVLAALDSARRVEPVQSRMRRAVDAAERHLTKHLAEPVNVAELASRLGIGYSHFRRAFREHTGFSPWQYVLHLRLSRARRLLASTDDTLEQIAERLGFSSAFHLSSAFKRECGTAPAHWRKNLLSCGEELVNSPRAPRAD